MKGFLREKKVIKTAISFFLFVFCFFILLSSHFFFYKSRAVITFSDKGSQAGIIDQTISDISNWAQDFSLTEFLKKTWKTAGSEAAGSALSSVLNQIAYDTATWIGSGGKG